MRKLPTIEELEAILNCDNSMFDVRVNVDGSVSAYEREDFQMETRQVMTNIKSGISHVGDQETGPGDEDCQPKISFNRRKELLAFAVELAELVRTKAKPHELCMLRGFTHGLLERD